MKMKYVFIIVIVLLLIIPLTNVFAGGKEKGEKKLVYGYVSPGPDTWYKRAEDGFKWAADILGVETVILNSEYDVQKEVDNINSLVTQGVDGMGMFSFNPQGAIVAAEKTNEADIPLVTVDNVGQVLEPQYDVWAVAAIDFDWAGMGKTYAEWMAENHSGKKVALIAGLLEHIPTIVLTKNIEERVSELGKNEIVAKVNGEFNPEVAVNKAQDLVQSGLAFEMFWIMDEDMAGAVIRYLDGQGLLDDYIIMAENGSPAGIPLVKQGKLNFTISSSPGWEGMIACLALHHYVTGNSTKKDQQIMLPVISVTLQNIDDKEKVVPWEADLVWIDLTKEYFPELGAYLPDKSEIELPK